MADAHFRVQVESDHLKRLSAARPIPAMSELIWNALDADATRVDLEVDADEVAMRSITVRDNGKGFTIAADERFRHLQTRWSFWVVSNDLDAFAQMRTRQKDKPRGQIFQSDDGRVEVWAKSWSEIIEACKARMKFVQDHLKANVDRESSLKHLKQTYAKVLSGVAEEYAPAETDAEPEGRSQFADIATDGNGPHQGSM